MALSIKSLITPAESGIASRVMTAVPPSVDTH
jgi:hypothetical protein